MAPRSHWPDLRALILVASAAQKDISSTAGMQATVHTSGLFPARVQTLVPERMAAMEAAIQSRDFPTFARITMRESNSFHATCLDTEPPIFYLNDVSRAAIQAVQAINAKAGQLVAAYTFDAGPNAVVYYEQKAQQTVLGWFESVLGEKEGWRVGGIQIDQATTSEKDPEQEQHQATQPPPTYIHTLRTGIQRVIHTSVGDGPVSVQDHLIDQRGDPVTS